MSCLLGNGILQALQDCCCYFAIGFLGNRLSGCRISNHSCRAIATDDLEGARDQDTTTFCHFGMDGRGKGFQDCGDVFFIYAACLGKCGEQFSLRQVLGHGKLFSD